MQRAESFCSMTESVADKIIKNVFNELRPGDVLSFVFRGGEPTVEGLNFF